MAAPTIDVSDILSFFPTPKDKEKQNYWFYNVDLNDNELKSLTYSFGPNAAAQRPHVPHKILEAQDMTRLPSYNITSKRQRSQQASSPYDFRISVDPADNWEAVSIFDTTTIQTASVPETVFSEDIAFVGTAKQVNTKYVRVKPKEPIPVTPVPAPVQTSIMEDPKIAEIAKEPRKAAVRIFTTDKCLASVAVCGRSVLPFDLVFSKKGQDVYVYPSNPESGSVIETNLESINTTYPVQRNDCTLEFTKLCAESTELNKSFVSVMTKDQPTTTFEPSEQAVPYLYRRIVIRNVEVVVRCEIDAIAAPVKEGERPRFSLLRTFNEVQLPHRTSNWTNDLSNKRGTILTTEVTDNVAKFARWITISRIANFESVYIGFSTRKNNASAKSHQILGVELNSSKRIANIASLSDANIMGVIHLVFSKLEKAHDGKYAFVRDAKKKSFRLYDTKSE